MSCYINVTPTDLFEAKHAIPTSSHSFNGLASWLLTTTFTILGSNHTEPTRPADMTPTHSSRPNSDLVLAVSSPLAYQLLPAWLTSSKEPNAQCDRRPFLPIRYPLFAFQHPPLVVLLSLHVSVLLDTFAMYC
ncbi:hypothetical protein AG1IA_01944 [Rhizoctonia solani AG-1 IA]|uniref:Uncharacterized protein n=1 Tax=Thanatephorus cucumeris (strain AG1-IA) TaxID=983506 RepID=L8X4R3_THACA|nr:hypothetical protein AG1IA_01944 [Rhizoctonia solani AG-1 IA]